MSNQDDAIFIRNFSMVLVGLMVIGIIAFILAKIVNGHAQADQEQSQAVTERVAPVGQVNTGGEPLVLAGSDTSAGEADATGGSAAAESSDPGKAAYDSVCFTCHAQGIAGAPKFGDMAAWESRLAKGRDELVANVINGYTGESGIMPPRGGNPNLSDEAIGAAVDYMTAALDGGNASTTAAPAAEPAATAEAPAETQSTAAASGRGKEVYDAACFVCHAPGAAGAPKFGDADAWSARIEKGIDTLYEHSLKGFMGEAGMMPPKGGRPDFSDDDVKAAVDYMVENAQ